VLDPVLGPVVRPVIGVDGGPPTEAMAGAIPQTEQNPSSIAPEQPGRAHVVTGSTPAP
jgi:hypothetical protein